MGRWLGQVLQCLSEWRQLVDEINGFVFSVDVVSKTSLNVRIRALHYSARGQFDTEWLWTENIFEDVYICVTCTWLDPTCCPTCPCAHFLVPKPATEFLVAANAGLPLQPLGFRGSGQNPSFWLTNSRPVGVFDVFWTCLIRDHSGWAEGVIANNNG